MNLASVIASLGTGTYTVTRTAAATWASGRATAGATSPITIDAVILPVTGKKLERLPEGMRNNDVIAIWTSTLLRTSEGADSAFPDLVTYGGKSYQVEVVEAWAESGSYYKYLAMKRD